MKKLLIVALAGLSLAIIGCAASTESVTSSSGSTAALITCFVCGEQFATQQQLESHYKAHPDHQTVRKSAIIKCSTCGQEFTVQQGLDAHLKAHPGHAPQGEFVPRSANIKCSTCGQEFTIQQGVGAYEKAHPKHMQ